MLEATTSFERFCRDVQPKLRHAFAAKYGHADGAEATGEALLYAWEHWNRLREMDNPAGYLYRVGQSRTRRIRRTTPLLAPVPDGALPHVEPGLPKALAALSENQRVAVTLVSAFGWKQGEVADLLGVSVSTVRNHLERGLTRLRREIGAT